MFLHTFNICFIQISKTHIDTICQSKLWEYGFIMDYFVDNNIDFTNKNYSYSSILRM